MLILPFVNSPPERVKVPVCTVLPKCTKPPLTFTLCKSVIPLTVNACPNTTSLVGTVTTPVPLARNSKSAVEAVASTVVPLICTSPMLASFAVMFAVTVKLLASMSPVTDKLLVIFTSLLGTSISPVPLARNSKSTSVVVVVIKLSSINISSNCAAAPTVRFCPTVKSSVSV